MPASHPLVNGKGKDHKVPLLKALDPTFRLPSSVSEARLRPVDPSSHASLAHLRSCALSRLQTSWDAIIDRYSSTHFADDDEIDLVNLEVVHHGSLLSHPNPIAFGSLTGYLDDHSSGTADSAASAAAASHNDGNDSESDTDSEDNSEDDELVLPSARPSSLTASLHRNTSHDHDDHDDNLLLLAIRSLRPPLVVVSSDEEDHDDNEEDELTAHAPKPPVTPGPTTARSKPHTTCSGSTLLATRRISSSALSGSPATASSTPVDSPTQQLMDAIASASSPIPFSSPLSLYAPSPSSSPCAFFPLASPIPRSRLSSLADTPCPSTPAAPPHDGPETPVPKARIPSRRPTGPLRRSSRLSQSATLPPDPAPVASRTIPDPTPEGELTNAPAPATDPVPKSKSKSKPVPKPAKQPAPPSSRVTRASTAAAAAPSPPATRRHTRASASAAPSSPPRPAPKARASARAPAKPSPTDTSKADSAPRRSQRTKTAAVASAASTHAAAQPIATLHATAPAATTTATTAQAPRTRKRPRVASAPCDSPGDPATGPAVSPPARKRARKTNVPAAARRPPTATPPPAPAPATSTTPLESPISTAPDAHAAWRTGHGSPDAPRSAGRRMRAVAWDDVPPTEPASPPPPLPTPRLSTSPLLVPATPAGAPRVKHVDQPVEHVWKYSWRAAMLARRRRAAAAAIAGGAGEEAGVMARGGVVAAEEDQDVGSDGEDELLVARAVVWRRGQVEP